MPDDIKSLTKEEVAGLLGQWDEPAYRADQILQWIHGKRATRWEAMTNLPGALRDRLRAACNHDCLALVRRQGAADTTQKFLWRLRDGALVESVLIPANPALYGEPSDRHTLCLSTQVGCAYGCKFCASGLEGWRRNLSPDEMVDQVLAVERWHSEQDPPASATGGNASAPAAGSPVPDGGRDRAGERCVSNIVVMGMGEPLANYDHLIKALAILNAPWGAGIGARKITISTSGLVPQIRRLAEDPHQFRLAISLHGPTDPVRDRLMPVNRKYPLKDLTAACEYYVERKGRMITLEYILIAGVNDDPALASPLATLARRLHAKVNLIPYNQVDGLDWTRPEPAVQEAFLRALESRKVTATLRREKGHDIDAACGQLRLKVERDSGNPNAAR